MRRKFVAGLEKTKNVSPYLNKNGFTLLESILSLVVTIIIFSLVPFLWQTEKRIIEATNITHSSEWHIFLKQLRQEIGNSELAIRTENKFCTLSEKEVCFEFYKDVVRKQVDGKGHEPLLTNISKFSFSIHQTSLLINAETTSNKKFSTHISIERE